MLEQQGRGGDLLDNFVKGYILDGMAKNMDPPAPKTHHRLLLHEQMFLLYNGHIGDVSSCVCCEAEIKGSAN